MDRLTAERTALAREDGIILTPEEVKRRRSRSIAIALVLGGMVILFFVLSMTRLGQQV